MKKLSILAFIVIFISILSTNAYAKQKDEDRYPIPIRSTYTSVIGNMDKSSNIFNNQTKQTMFKKSMKHFRTLTLFNGHYVFIPKDDGFHGARGMQWLVEADLNNNIIRLGINVTTQLTRLQGGPIKLKSVEIHTPFGAEKFYLTYSDSDYSVSTAYTDIGYVFPLDNALSARMARILTFMLKSKPNETWWFGYGVRDEVNNHFSESDIRGMKDAVELFELLISI